MGLAASDGAAYYPCVYCEHPMTKVIDSRFYAGRRVRRRLCPECDLRFSTEEVVFSTYSERDRLNVIAWIGAEHGSD